MIAEPVSKKDCPHYYSSIEHPVDCSMMLQKAHAGTYDAGRGKKSAKNSVWEGRLNYYCAYVTESSPPQFNVLMLS